MAENQAVTPNTDDKPKLKKLAQFQTPDGKIFNTQKEAGEHLRAHLVVDALTKVVAGSPVTVEWLQKNKVALLKAYDAAVTPRPPITEETKKKMALARAMSPEQRAAAKAAAEKAKAAAKAAKAASIKK